MVDTNNGCYGFLPHRLDCVAIVVPCVLTYETKSKAVHYIALDEGLLIKTGDSLLVSVRNAVGGTDLGKLRSTIDDEFRKLDQNERRVRSAVAKLESEFIESIKRLKQQ